MDKTLRDKIKRKARTAQIQYLDALCSMPEKGLIAKKLHNFNNKFKHFLRCEYASSNSIKQIPHLSSLIWGIQDYLRQLRIVPYSFKDELSAINTYLITALECVCQLETA